MKTIRRIAYNVGTVGIALSIALLAIGASRSAAADPSEENSRHGSGTPAAKSDPSRGAGEVTTNHELGARIQQNRLGDVVVVAIRKNGPAERNGIRPGDEIVSVNGNQINTIADVDRALRQHDPDRDLQIVIKPSTQPRYITVASQRSRGTASNHSKATHHAMMGVTLNAEDKRVVVAQLYSGGPAEKAGVKSGDVIESVDGHPVASNQDVLNILGEHKTGDSVGLLVERNGWRRDVQVKLSPAANVTDRPLLTEGRNTTTRAQGPIVVDVTDEDEGNVLDQDEESWQTGDTYENIRDPFLRARNTDFD